jgi:hypothetical protein
VFLNSRRRKTPENAIKQKSRGKTDIEIFVDFCFRHGLFVKMFNGVFELPLLRNAQKRTKNKFKKKKVGWWVGGSEI